MALMYRDPFTGALRTRCDAGAQARHMICDGVVTDHTMPLLTGWRRSMAIVT